MCTILHMNYLGKQVLHRTEVKQRSICKPLLIVTHYTVPIHNFFMNLYSPEPTRQVVRCAKNGEHISPCGWRGRAACICWVQHPGLKLNDFPSFGQCNVQLNQTMIMASIKSLHPQWTELCVCRMGRSYETNL